MCNKNGYSAIAAAASMGMDECVDILLSEAHERGLNLTEILEQKTNRGETPLLLACSYGWIDCVRTLVREGADIKTLNNDGFSPWLSASEHGHFDIMRLLFEEDACARCDAVGRPVVMDGLVRGYPLSPIIFSLNETLAGWTALHLACRNGFKHAVRYLWDKGGNVLLEMNRYDGRTPLMSLVKNGDEGYESRCKIAEFLLEKCPGMLERLDSHGRSCLHIAAEGDQVRILELIFSKVSPLVTICNGN